jgi:cytoskeleton-associated protein 5
VLLSILLIHQITLQELIPGIDNGLKNKNPQVKEGTLKLLGRCLASATSPIQPAQVKPLSETLAVLLEDGYEGARTESATCFGYLMRMVGERPLNAIMENLADMRKAKVKEAFEKAVVKCKVGGAPPPRTNAPSGSSTTVKKGPPAASSTPGEDVPPPAKKVPKAAVKPLAVSS